MERWKDLGEVPDSEDDSSQDLELDEAPVSLLEIPGQEGATQDVPTTTTDVWDIPSSSPDLKYAFSQASRRVKLSNNAQQVADAVERNEGALLVPARVEEEGHVEDQEMGDIRSSAPELPIFQKGEQDQSTLHNRPALAPDSPASSLSSLSSCDLSLPPSPSRTTRPPQPEAERMVVDIGSQGSERESRPIEQEEKFSQIAVPLERSLRPRKPIQQHPYLLESAQYASLMKSRGVKPIRMQLPQSDPVDAETDSQDKDFDGEESQLHSEHLNTNDDSSGPMVLDNDAYELDELALSPTPITSSTRRRPPASLSDEDTDATSLADDEDMPSLEDILRNPAKAARVARRRRNRNAPPKNKTKSTQADPLASSPPRAFVRPHRLSTSPPVFENIAGPSSDLGATPAPSRPNRIEVLIPSMSSVRNSPWPTPRQPKETVDLTGVASDASDASSTASESASEAPSDSERIQNHVRRIRGVLPASWLRLDQMKGKPQNAKKPAARDPSPPAEAPQKGVAVLRRSNQKAPVFSLSDFSDEEAEDSLRARDLEDVPMMDNGIFSPPRPRFSVFDDSDPGAGMEDNRVERVRLGNKRNRPGEAGDRASKKRKTLFQGRTDSKTHQPRINEVLGSMETRPKRRHSHKDKQLRRSTAGAKPYKQARPRAAKPQYLSILDVLEPDAPRFVRIAARTVRARDDLGKTSPSRKIIQLATRSDNVDALSTLRDWKSGKTQPKVSAKNARQASRPKARQPLGDLDTNSASRPWPSGLPLSSLGPRTLARSATLDGFATPQKDHEPWLTQVPAPVQPAKRISRKTLQLRGPQYRPAQLETEDIRGVEREVFKARKNVLDTLYRKARKGQHSQAPSVVSTRTFIENLASASKGAGHATRTEPERPLAVNPKSRFRKRFVPQRVDRDAPMFLHVNDPLPAPEEILSVARSEVVAPTGQTSQDKLKGLGPYGTVYTQHFEVFPLDSGTYFHASTLIGSGCISKFMHPDFRGKLRHVRPSISFTLDERTLRWAAWNETTSSELGILVDWLAEKLSPDSAQPLLSETSSVDAASFVLDYLLNSVSFQDDVGEEACLLRVTQVMHTLVARLESLNLSVSSRKVHIGVCVHFAVAVMAVYQIALANGSDFSLVAQIEELLIRWAKLCIKALVGLGFKDITDMYGDLQRAYARERGIRGDQVTANGWVVLMRLLDNAQIPRSSFWDLTGAILLQPDTTTSSDAQQFEDVWRSFFTLLPLSEFDNTGVLVSGSRHNMPMEGWALPQRLLRPVFDLYKANPRQPPSFNAYCRALLARCHYLAQQWGWSKCSGIIGIIFDFFGSQDLAHLRNEEVDRSPAFLEKLAEQPSLAIEPEDRCFHIFIKVLAIAIQRLKKQGRAKDIRNLVARTLPNHNRQYSKEDTIHQHDLAALRNHHDLLCTLFWAAPPDLRPAVHLIEKLVVPETSHKEAVLINIRAWGQLASFLVASDADKISYKPFIAWQNNVFQHSLDQYLSAALDIEQQFRALPAHERDISTAMKEQMILKNKAAAMDVMYMSMKASFQASKHASSVGMAAFVLNLYQLQRTFGSLDFSVSGFDWGIVRLALDTVEHYLTRVEEAKASEEQYSSEASSDVDPAEIEDAIQLLDVHLARDFFAMGRTILRLPSSASAKQANEQALCVEKMITLGARIATRFFRDKITLLAPYFTSSKYGLFSRLPKDLDSSERKYLPLFLATLIKNQIFSFGDLGSTLLTLWMLSAAKPRPCLQYENYLASLLKQAGLPFLKHAIVPVTAPDYNANHDYLCAAIHHMRKSLREAPAMQARRLREEYKETLILVMKKMRQDLRELVSKPSEHKAYMAFVRQVISLIKSHGVGICVVDAFFTQPSLEYSPPLQDPQLHVDGIIGYGVKIGEKDLMAIPQLFHYLYNNFKIALVYDKLQEERRNLEKAMGHQDILAFMMQYMLPATITATSTVPEAWLLLDVYVGTTRGLLTRSCLPLELRADDLVHCVVLVQYVLAWFSKLPAERQEADSTMQQLHIMNKLVGLVSALQPNIRTYLYRPSDDGEARGTTISPDTAKQVVVALGRLLERAAQSLARFLKPVSMEGMDCGRVGESDAMSLPGDWWTLFVEDLRESMSPDLVPNSRINEFTNHIVTDVRRGWVVTPSLVTIRMASKATSTPNQSSVMGSSQSVNGTRPEAWSLRKLLVDIQRQVGSWNLRLPQASDGARNRGRGCGRVKRREPDWDMEGAMLM